MQPEEGRRRLSSEGVEGSIKEAEKKMSEAKELIRSAKEAKVMGQKKRAKLYEKAATRYGEAAELLKSVGKSQEAAEAILHKAYALEEAEKTETNPGKKAELWERIADAHKERAELLKSVGKFQEAAKAIESKVYTLGKAAKITTNPEKMAELRKLIADAHKERAELLEEAQKLQQAAWAMRFSADVLKEVAQAEKDPEKRAELYEEAATRYGEAEKLFRRVWKLEEAAWAIWYKAYVLKEVAQAEKDPEKRAELYEEAATRYGEAAELLKSVGKLEEAAWAIRFRADALKEAEKTVTNPKKKTELWKLIADAHRKRAEILEKVGNLEQAAGARLEEVDALKEAEKTVTNPGKKAELWKLIADAHRKRVEILEKVGNLEQAAGARLEEVDALKEAEKTVTNPKKKTELWKLIADAHRKRAEILESDGKLKLEKAANARLEEAYALKEAANATKDLEGKSELLRAAERAYDEVAKLYESAGKPDKVALVRVYKEEALKEVRKIQEELSSRTPTEDKT